MVPDLARFNLDKALNENNPIQKRIDSLDCSFLQVQRRKRVVLYQSQGVRAECLDDSSFWKKREGRGTGEGGKIENGRGFRRASLTRPPIPVRTGGNLLPGGSRVDARRGKIPLPLRGPPSSSLLPSLLSVYRPKGYRSKGTNTKEGDEVFFGDLLRTPQSSLHDRGSVSN